MSDSEKLKTFDEKRDEFKPYGLTCEIGVRSLCRKSIVITRLSLIIFPKGVLPISSLQEK